MEVLFRLEAKTCVTEGKVGTAVKTVKVKT
jgi:hypothetical protein